MADDAPVYDFICLCCGGRNGERKPSCSFLRYVEEEGDTDSDEFRLKLAEWLSSDDYKGSLLVPADHPLSEDYRKRIIEMTESFRRSRTGILLFGLPGIELPAHTVNLSQFLN